MNMICDNDDNVIFMCSPYFRLFSSSQLIISLLIYGKFLRVNIEIMSLSDSTILNGQDEA